MEGLEWLWEHERGRTNNRLKIQTHNSFAKSAESSCLYSSLAFILLHLSLLLGHKTEETKYFHIPFDFFDFELKRQNGNYSHNLN